MNKKGGEKYLSIWWFFVLVVIGLGIVSGVIIHASAEANVKILESDILITRVIDCIVENGQINQEFMDGNFDIFNECSLSKGVIDEDLEHYLSIKVYDSTTLISEASYGNSEFETQCELEGKNYPECSERNIPVLSRQEEKLTLYIKAGSNQIGKQEASI